MKAFGIVSLIMAAIFYTIVFVNGIRAWFKRDKDDFASSMISSLIYIVWIVTAIFLIVVS